MQGKGNCRTKSVGTNVVWSERSTSELRVTVDSRLGSYPAGIKMFSTIARVNVLYKCETSSHILSEEQRW
jgi:hypothetical protein